MRPENFGAGGAGALVWCCIRASAQETPIVFRVDDRVQGKDVPRHGRDGVASHSALHPQECASQAVPAT